LSRNIQKTICYEKVKRREEKARSRPKILVIFFHPTSLVTAMGGAEKRFTETLKTFCSENNLETTVLESAPSLLEETEITCKRHLVSSSFHGKGWLGTYLEWSFWIFKSSLKSFRLIRQEKPNTILVPNNTLPNLIPAYVICRVSQRPMCVVVHHIDVLPYRNNGKDYSLYSSYRSLRYDRVVSLVKTLASYLSLPLLNTAKAIIVVSNFTAEALRNSGVARPQIFVSGNAVNRDLIAKAGNYSEEKVYDGIFVGRITKEKGVFDLLKIWEEVIKARRNAKLLIVGDGLELSTVKERILTSDLTNNVHARGRCSEDELYSLLKSSRIFIFPSLFEGWGIAVAEALACGLPVVAYDIPALREVFGNCSSVFLVPLKNLESITSTVLDVLASNGKKMKELSKCSRLYARRFDWEKISKQDLHLLKTIHE